MSAIGPQFYEFMKKLDENNGKLPTSITSRPFQPEFEFNNITCYLCNGYYGPSFGEPVCVTCHEFIYPDIPHHIPNSYARFSEKTDDGDSGNDEPSVGELMFDQRLTKALKQHGIPLAIPNWAFRFQNSLDSETSPEDLIDLSIRPSISVSVGGASGSNGANGADPSNEHSLRKSPSHDHGLRAGPSQDHGLGAGPSRGHSLGAGPSRDHGLGAGSSRDHGLGAGSSRDHGLGAGPSRDRGLGIDPSIDHGLGAGPSRDHDLGPGLPNDDGLDPPVPDDDQPRLLSSNLARSLAALSTPRLPDNLAPGLVEQLPSEVLLCMFSYLDDLSLCACAQVCARWFRLVRARVAQPRWADFANRRWPLYRPMVNIHDWHKKYQSLVESCFCRNCVVQMCVQSQPPFEENAWRRNRLRNEIKMLRNSPPEGCAATPLDPKSCHWQAMVTGPVGSPYEGGVFYLYIQVPYSYPMSPPVVRFLTRILHPNVSRHGDVGIDSVHHNWSLALTISKLLISIQSLLTDPYTAVCMEPEVGEMYVSERARFDRIARRWTWRYAMHDIYSIN